MLRALEGRVGAEAASLMMQMPLLRLQAQRGNGEPVMVLPGFLADDVSTWMLRQFLKNIGYQVYPWEMGVNRRPMLEYLPRLAARVQALNDQHSQSVRLVGWSRGGIMSREIARDFPGLVDRVVTIGSPVKGGVQVSSISKLVQRETGLSPQDMSNVLKQRQRKLIQVPITAIYSKLDGVVAWQSCIDDVSPDVEHFEIHGTHVGMGVNPEVYKLLPKLLAAS